MSIDAIFWMRLSTLKAQLDALSVRVTHLEHKPSPPPPPEDTPRMGFLKRSMDIISMITTAHGAIPWIWPAIVTAIGIGWKIISKAFS